MINIGIRPAYDLIGKIIIIDKELRDEPLATFDFSVANEIPTQTPTPWYTDGVQLPSDVSPQYIMLAIKYSDPILKQSFSQVFFMKWDGAVKGRTQPDFVHVSKEEKQKVAEHFTDLLKDFK